MPTNKQCDIMLDRSFDPFACRHQLNGHTNVLHCHHYATLYTQLANDCGMLDGGKLLADVSEDTFYPILAEYYEAHNVTDIADRITLAEQYYSVTGLGKMKIKCAGPDSGEIELTSSHVDAGWIKKWGKNDKPINFITCGYISAAFAAVFGKPLNSYSVSEAQSIVAGAKSSTFEAVAN